MIKKGKKKFDEYDVIKLLYEKFNFTLIFNWILESDLLVHQNFHRLGAR